MKSKVRTYFEGAESPKWMAVKPIIRQEWDACLHIFEGHRQLVNDIQAVTFSPDNSKLASIICPATIEVWDLTLGVLLQRLHDNMPATKAVISSNGNTLVLLSYHNVEIWDLIGGSLIKKICHTGIKSVAFIAGDAHLSMLGPQIFKIYDIAKNVDLHTYSGQPGEKFRDVIFSSSYVQLALSSVNGGIETQSPASWALVPYFANKTFGARLVVTCKHKTSTLLKVLDSTAGEYMQMILTLEAIPLLSDI
jgi:WD40 repeat protein